MSSELEISAQITWVYTENLDASCRFYGSVLGFPLERNVKTAMIYRTAAQSFIGVCEAFGDRVVEPEGSMITFVTGDVDGCYERLTAAGADVDGPPHTLEQFGIYTFFARDPNGYRIEFQKFLEP